MAWGNLKRNNIHIMEIPEQKRKERYRKCKEIIAENHLILGNDPGVLI